MVDLEDVREAEGIRVGDRIRFCVDGGFHDGEERVGKVERIVKQSCDVETAARLGEPCVSFTYVTDAGIADCFSWVRKCEVT